MININLLPSAQRPSVVVFDSTLAIGLALIALEVVAIIGFDLYENSIITQLNNQYTDLAARVTQEQQAVREVDDLRDQAAQLQAKAELLERIKQSPLQLAEVLTDLGYQDPRGVQYTNLKVAHATTGGGSVSITGACSNYSEVADLMLNLDGSPIFGNATLHQAQQQVKEGQTSPGGLSFDMTGDLNGAVVGQ